MWAPLKLTEKQRIIISTISDQIIPPTDTPGATDAGVPAHPALAWFVELDFGRLVPYNVVVPKRLHEQEHEVWVYHGVDAPTEVSPNGVLIEPMEFHRDVKLPPPRINSGHPDTGKQVRRIDIQHELQPAWGPFHFISPGEPTKGFELTKIPRSLGVKSPVLWGAKHPCRERYVPAKVPP